MTKYLITKEVFNRKVLISSAHLTVIFFAVFVAGLCLFVGKVFYQALYFT
jgi:hypothetical protein